jgi:hypothetical protein
VFVTVITNVAVLPGKRQTGLFEMAAVKLHAKPAATVSAEDVIELEVLDVPETVAQPAPVLAHAVNLTVAPAGPVRV